MIDRRRHHRAPLRRSSVPEKLLAGGLAAAVCIGIVGVIGVRTMDADADTVADTTDAAPIETPVETTTDALVVSKDGLTREQLDAYAAALAAEKHRLDVYRVNLVRAAKQLQASSTTPVSASTVLGATSETSETSDEAAPASTPRTTPVAKPVVAKPVVAQPAAAQPAAAAAQPAQTTTKSS